MKIAKNVENLGDAAFVKAKGTWYRARKCHKVKKNKIFKDSDISLSHADKTDSFAYVIFYRGYDNRLYHMVIG